MRGGAGQVGAHVETIRQALLRDLQDPVLGPQARKALALRAEDWPRQTRFLADPTIPW